MIRLHALALLLRCVKDVEYNDPTWSSSLRRQSIAGEGPSTTVACGTCQGEGQIRRRGIAYPCDNPYCHDGKVTVDAYTLRMISTTERHVQQLKLLRCDACGGNGAFPNGHRCLTCEGSGWTEVPLERLKAVRVTLSVDGPDLGPSDPVLATMERRQQFGSFDELGLALAALRLEYRARYRLVAEVYLLGLREADELRLDEAMRLQQGLDYLERLMPEPIRVPSWAARNERRRREQLKKKRSQEAAA